ncbi:MAG: 50S ribosomal protein L9 [Anaerolineae bacterium]|nr:50S ribosomal protein L9 [Anaerolineales bacterium]MCB8935893.1 50S ribosomal protein L9 [Promineifilum sp.]MCW5847841.1 50S ribosomal protein L9 [Anaerolineae bacterium]
MKVLLKEDVDNLGYAGEVHTVADGYGRNFLLPKGMAVKANPNALKQADAWRKRAETHRAELRAEYDVLSDKIRAVVLSFTARAGDNGKLFGSITTQQIADKLNEELGTEIDRRKVGTETLRQVGEHMVPVRLSADHHPEFRVIVLQEGAPAVAETAEMVESDEAEPVVEAEEDFESEEAGLAAEAEA